MLQPIDPGSNAKASTLAAFKANLSKWERLILSTVEIRAAYAKVYLNESNQPVSDTPKRKSVFAHHSADWLPVLVDCKENSY